MESYALLILPLSAGIMAQVIKFFIFSLRHGFDWRFLFEYGHMPSSHTAMMVSLISAIGYYQGVKDNPVFAVAVAVTVLIVSDALRLRMYIGSYGKTINNLVEQLSLDSEPSVSKLKERVGHRPQEIFWGAVLGLLATVIWIGIFG